MMNSFSIAKKLTLGFAISVIMMIIIGATSLYLFNKMGAAVNEISTNAMPSLILAENIKYSISSVRRLEAQATLTTDTVERENIIKRLGAEEEKIKSYIKEYFPMIVDEADKICWENVNRTVLAYFEHDHLLIQKLKEPVIDTLALSDIIFSKSRATYKETVEASEAMSKYNIDYTYALGKGVAESKSSGQIIIISLIIIISIISIILSIRITGLITVPILAAVKTAENIADGNLIQKIQNGNNDETGLLLNSLKTMQSNLNGLVKDVRESAEGINTSAAEIAAGNNDLSSRTENQASALEETAASMEELSSTVKHNSENANKANSLAVTATDEAKEGGIVVAKVVVTMNDINESSKKISDIINVIDGIAFQTNILALNAAVEAARAGEQGRGFAVVASEVRNLAHRSSSAAKEIKTLINDSTEQIHVGVALANDAGNKMDGIVSSIQNLSTLMSEISDAGRQQSQGILQIGEAINEMDEVTQQNAALVEEMAAASEQLNQQSIALIKNVQQFKTT